MRTRRPRPAGPTRRPGAATGRCDRAPTGVAAEDHWLDFTVPAGLMPDARFDGRPARLQVHRVRPVYARGKCAGGPTRAAVLVHGRRVSGPAQFDVRHPAPGGGDLSLQTSLARAGIDTLAPSLLGYGLSTRFQDGLDDPGNASLRPYEADGSCTHPEGCDRTHNPVFPLDQQGSLLLTNPLGGERIAHSSSARFARTDVWVRDIRQVVDDAVARAKPTGGKVTLIGYSLGGVHVARALYAGNTMVPGAADTLRKVNRVVFMSSLFGFPTEEVTPPAGFATFPLTLNTRPSPTRLPQPRDQACTGRVVPGAADTLWDRILAQDPIGRDWGGTEPGNPTGLNRTPTFSTYGWNADVAGRLTPPTLVIHGLDDIDPAAPPTNATAIYDALPATMTNKALVHVACATHELLLEGCTGARCLPQAATVYGGRPGVPWAGPQATVKAALAEWIKSGTFNGAATGRFLVDESGVAEPVG
ncbi:alpha/beta fold hydrolase [Streptomyces sp. NPDC060031]|uniref:alpha/beta fold hydrolase n=1 Tax=Streptomyces sp. NPDC060031 TaxID=3347043 RepID=UPI003685B77E